MSRSVVCTPRLAHPALGELIEGQSRSAAGGLGGETLTGPDTAAGTMGQEPLRAPDCDSHFPGTSGIGADEL